MAVKSRIKSSNGPPTQNEIHDEEVLACQFSITPCLGGSSPCGELVLAFAGMAVGIHLLGPGWGHLASSHDASFRERFSVKFIGFKLNI